MCLKKSVQFFFGHSTCANTSGTYCVCLLITGRPGMANLKLGKVKLRPDRTYIRPGMADLMTDWDS